MTIGTIVIDYPQYFYQEFDIKCPSFFSPLNIRSQKMAWNLRSWKWGRIISFSKIDIFIHSTAFIYQFRFSANTALHNLSFNVFLSGDIVNSFNGVFIIKTFDISSEIIIIKSRLNSSFEFQEMVGQNFFLFAKKFLKPIVKQYNTSLNLKSGKFKL